MTNPRENPKEIALPKVVRLTAVTLLVYSLAIFIFGIFLPLWAYNTARGFDFIGVPLYILIGLFIILVSFGLFEGSYQLLLRRAYGSGVGTAATICSLLPGVWAVLFLSSINCEKTLRVGTCEVKQFSAVILYSLFIIILMWGLTGSGKILNKE